MIRIFLCILVLFAIGCTPAPRYRSGASELPAQTNPSNTSRSTDAVIKLGGILQSYLGKPYAGSSKYEKGLDCSLFTSEVFKKYARLSLPRTAEGQFALGKTVARGSLKFGDLVFFNTGGKKVSHVGIYIGHNEFIHASTSNGVMISKLSEKYWAQKYLGARDILD